MGLIIGWKQQGTIHLAADSNHVMAVHPDTFKNQENYKFWRTPGNPDVLMAYVGPYKRIANLLKHIDLFDNEDVTFASIVNTFVPKLRSLLRDVKLLAEDDHQLLGRYLIATTSDLYAIEFDGFVLAVEEFIALGSGKKIATGVHQSLKDRQDLSDIDKVERLFTITTEQDYKVSYPVITTSVGSKQVTVLEAVSSLSRER